MANINETIVVGFLDSDDDKMYDDEKCELHLVTTHRRIKGVSTEDRYSTVNIKKVDNAPTEETLEALEDTDTSDAPIEQMFSIGKTNIKNPVSPLEIEYGSVNEKRLAKVLSDKKIKKNDFLYIQGKIVTDNSIEEVDCPCCCTKVDAPVYDSYVYPIFANKVNSGDWDDDDDSRYIPRRVLATQWKEISNSAKLLGTVEWIDGSGLRALKGSEKGEEDVILNYLIRIDPAGDFMTPTLKHTGERAEHIMVRSFGSQALTDYERLRLGSLVYVNGYIRFAYDTVKCPKCHTEILHPDDGKPWRTSQVIVMAYKVEYMAGIKSLDFDETEREALNKDENDVEEEFSL